MHQISLGGRAPPGPAGGAYSAPPDPLAKLKGPTSKGRVGEGWKKRGRGGEGEEGKGGRAREGPMSLSPPPEMKSCVRPCMTCDVFPCRPRPVCRWTWLGTMKTREIFCILMSRPKVKKLDILDLFNCYITFEYRPNVDATGHVSTQQFNCHRLNHSV